MFFVSPRNAKAGLFAVTFATALAVFASPARAQDLYVKSDSTVNSAYDNVYVGFDNASNPFPNVTAAITIGATIGHFTADNGSTVNMTGGTVTAGDLYNSTANFSGGTITGEISAYSNSSVNVSGAATLDSLYISGSSNAILGGGTVNLLNLYGTGTVTGGSLSAANVRNAAALTVTGNTLAATKTGSFGYYDATVSANRIIDRFNLTGNLTNSDAINASINAASQVTGNANTLTFAGSDSATIADDLYISDSGAPSGIYSGVVIGYDSGFVNATSPIVTGGADFTAGDLSLYNTSDVSLTDSDITHSLNLHDTSTAIVDSTSDITSVTTGDHSNLTIGANTLSDVQASGDSTLEVGYGNITHLASSGNSATFLDSGAGVQNADVSDTATLYSFADISNLSLYGGEANIYGGSVGEIYGTGGTLNLYGGIVAPNTLYNLNGNTGLASLFNIYGTSFGFGNIGTQDFYSHNGTTYKGIFWDLAGVLSDGTALSTHYFEANGDLSGPHFITINGGIALSGVSAPEPGTFALVFLGSLAIYRKRRR